MVSSVSQQLVDKEGMMPDYMIGSKNGI